MTLVHSIPDSDGSTPPSDAEVILAIRAGDHQAYGTLYERHLAAARAHARQLTPSATDADDLVAEAFAKVFTILRAGHGPDSAFRAYLVTTLRNGFYQRLRQDRRLELTDDITRHDLGVPWSDPVEAELESSLAARAFATLPERWQTVLWQSEVERRSAAEIGDRLGLRPNAVAALAYRAREGLRQAYLQAHLTELPDEGCRRVVHRLGGWTRGRLAAGDTALVRNHLEGCGRCRKLAAELGDVNDGIRGLLAPLALVGTTAGAGGASVGVAAAGPAVGATVASGSGSVIGSALGWLLGTSAGQAAAVLTAVAVGGTAVAAGTAVVDPGPSGSRPAAVAAAGSGPTVPAGAAPGRIDLRQTVRATKDKPASGKRSGDKPPNGKGPADKPPNTKTPSTAKVKPDAKGASNGNSPNTAKVKPDAKSASNGNSPNTANGRSSNANGPSNAKDLSNANGPSDAKHPAPAGQKASSSARGKPAPSTSTSSKGKPATSTSARAKPGAARTVIGVSRPAAPRR